MRGVAKTGARRMAGNPFNSSSRARVKLSSCRTHSVCLYKLKSLPDRKIGKILSFWHFICSTVELELRWTKRCASLPFYIIRRRVATTETAEHTFAERDKKNLRNSIFLIWKWKFSVKDLGPRTRECLSRDKFWHRKALQRDASPAKEATDHPSETKNSLINPKRSGAGVKRREKGDSASCADWN